MFTQENVPCTVIVKRKCALRHTSARCAQYLQDRGLLCDAPPCDLHNIYDTEICFGTHLCTICTVITNAFEQWAWALFPAEVRCAAHLREICTVCTNVCGHWAFAFFISEVCCPHTSARSAQFLPQLMRFGGAADLGLYNIKQGFDDTSMAKEGQGESCPTSGSEF